MEVFEQRREFMFERALRDDAYAALRIDQVDDLMRVGTAFDRGPAEQHRDERASRGFGDVDARQVIERTRQRNAGTQAPWRIG
jgi:hypothetical protein